MKNLLARVKKLLRAITESFRPVSEDGDETTGLLVEAIGRLNGRKQVGLTQSLRWLVRIHGTEKAHRLALMSAVYAMPKSESIEFINKITEGK